MSVDFEIPPLGPPRPGQDGAWIITRYRDVEAVLNAAEVEVVPLADDLVHTVSERLSGRFRDLVAILDSLPILAAGETHTSCRAASHALVKSLTVQALQRDLAAELEMRIEGWAQAGSIDAVTTIGRDLTDRLIGAALGFSAAELAELDRTRQIAVDDWHPMQRLEHYDRRQAAAREIHAAVTDHVRAGRCPILEDTGDEVVGALTFLVLIAADTGRAFVGNCLALLATRPDLQAELRGDRRKILAFVEEALRLAGPIKRRARKVALDGFRVGDSEIPAGSRLWVHLDAAGRDGDVYADPESIDLTRSRPTTAAFGFGSHQCLGRVLARAIARATVVAVLERFEVRPDSQPALQRCDPDVLAFDRLPLVLTPVPVEQHA